MSNVSEELYQNVYSSIYNHLLKEIRIEEPHERAFVEALALTASEGVVEYVRELEEALGHLQETVKRLSKS